MLVATQIAQVEKLAGYGLNEELIADFFGMCDDTLRQRMYEDPMISRAYKKGRAKLAVEIGNSLAEGVRRGETAMVIFACKTILGMRETNRTEITGANGGPLQMKPRSMDNLTDAELDAILAEAKRHEGDQKTDIK
jgi:hypothetical protein